ncbi:MAG TPA: hypothetical protein VGG48_17750 [Rhizomicrobium sp.]|jgi:hypothetical protein
MVFPLLPNPTTVMAGLVPATHSLGGKKYNTDRRYFFAASTAVMDGRDKPGHDGFWFKRKWNTALASGTRSVSSRVRIQTDRADFDTNLSCQTRRETMLVLSFCTPAKPMRGPPSAGHMQEMGKFAEGVSG